LDAVITQDQVTVCRDERTGIKMRQTSDSIPLIPRYRLETGKTEDRSHTIVPAEHYTCTDNNSKHETSRLKSDLRKD
jgi:hypothetical protein